MNNKITELQEEGLSIRNIAEELGLSKSKVEWELKTNKTESQDTPQQDTISQDNETLNETLNETEVDKIDYPNGHPKSDYNKIGVKKLRKSDYTPKEVKLFPDAPYYDYE